LAADKAALVRGYAAGLLAIAEAEGELGRFEDELFAFAKALEREVGLRQALTDPALPLERKDALVRDLLGDRASPLTASALDLIIEQGRARDLGRIVEELVRLAAERRRHVVAEVRSAVRLDERQRERLTAALSRATGLAVEVKVVVDPSVIGGVAARIGDEVFDGTVRTRLAEARRHLSGV
jgi:F-type H+-transporting ATPase subunit delta